MDEQGMAAMREYADGHHMTIRTVVMATVQQYNMNPYGFISDNEMAAVASHIYGKKLTFQQVAEIAQSITGRTATVVDRGGWAGKAVRMEEVEL